eukprot:695053-Amphidinium_carterae.1
MDANPPHIVRQTPMSMALTYVRFKTGDTANDGATPLQKRAPERKSVIAKHLPKIEPLNDKPEC